MKPDELEHILSASDEAAVESIYKKITTPLRCRLGLHKWNDWVDMLSIQFGAIADATLRASEMGQIDLQVRLCPDCMKTQARTVHVATDEVEPEEDDE